MCLKIFVCESKMTTMRGGATTTTVETYTFVHEWEARERERELFLTLFHSRHMFLLMDVGLLKFYEEGTSLRGELFIVTTIDPSLGSWLTNIQGRS
jgi:hypothetical protein